MTQDLSLATLELNFKTMIMILKLLKSSSFQLGLIFLTNELGLALG